MSVESNPTPPTSSGPSQLFGDEDPRALFDELPTYKAVVPTALLAPIFGLVSALSFTHYAFLLCSVAAILCGLLALRQIKKFPERSTGAGFAKLGITLGLIFGLASTTISGTQALLRIKAASDFGRQYAELIKKGSKEEVAFFHGVPEGREGKTPREVYEEMKKAAPQPEIFDGQLLPLVELQEILKIPGNSIEFDGLEMHGDMGMRIFAHARFKITGPGNEKHPGPVQYLLVRMNAHEVKGKYEWMVEEFRFPYKKYDAQKSDRVVP